MPTKGPEYQLQQQVTDLATILGWEHVHFRPALTKRGWRTPGTGSMAKGWPDLTLVRVRDRRLIFAELKSDRGSLTPDERRVLDVLRALEGVRFGAVEHPDGTELIDSARVEVHVWKPRDWDSIEQILR